MGTVSSCAHQGEPGWTATRRRAQRQRADVLARRHQRLVDVELRATRRALWHEARRRSGDDVTVLLDAEFLALADRPALYRAILVAALTASHARGVHLHRYCPDTNTLHLVAYHGLTPRLLDLLAALDAAAPTAYAAALTGGEPVLVSDITHSPLFPDPATRDALLAAGHRTAHCHPLATTGQVVGVLSLYHHGPRPGTALEPVRDVVSATAHVLSNLDSNLDGQRMP